jgi:YidC/Oxa1 family membrane protein insertase
VGNLLGTIFGPVGTIFNAIFYEPIYNVLMLIYNVIHAIGIPGGLGLSIIALTLLVRCCMIPLTRKQLKSSRAMQELAPQINALKVQYRGDPQGLMKAQQDLYKEHGYSPVSGCLPLLIQMPFLYALLFSFRNLLTEKVTVINKPIYSFLPHLTTAPDPHFLWVNLTTADPWHILPLAAAVFTFIQLRMAMPVRKKPVPGTPTDPTAQATQTTMYIMPVITFVIGLSFPAGLALYWTVGAMFASVQQYFLAGWGSLFLGIKGLEHLVPPPRELPSSNVAIAGSSRTGSSGARSLVASSSPTSSAAGSSPSEGGLRGLLRQFRDMSAAATQQAEEAAKARSTAKNGARSGTTVDGDAIVDAVPGKNNGTGQVAGANGAGGASSSAVRRARPSSKAAPMLVKRASSGDLPERAIERDGKDTDSASFKNDPLPEVAIANTAKKTNTAPAPAGRGSSTGSGTRIAAASAGTSSRPAGSKTSGNNGNAQRRAKSGAAAARNRNTNNRAKGGR